jgi:NAD(P)-dependent dehydrogenase (short-subunit alcohol dehydrogenase family)
VTRLLKTVHLPSSKIQFIVIRIMASFASVAIVTGGNSGMGIGLVEKLVERGWKVAVADINANPDFAAKLGDASSFHRCNVADYDRWVII